MSVIQETNMISKDVQIWNNAAFDNGDSEIASPWSGIKPCLTSINLSESLQSDATKENQIPSSMEESLSPVSLKSLPSINPLQDNTLIANGIGKQNPVYKIGVCEKKEEVNIDVEIEEIEKEIKRLSSRLESLRLEKAKRNAKVMEKRGRVVAAKFLDPPKESSTRSSNEMIKFEDSMSLSAKLKTPRRGLSLGPTEIMRGVRRGISLGPAEIYSASKLRQLSKQDVSTPVQQSANRRKSCYWKLHDIDELRVTKERGKCHSLSPKSRLKSGAKVQVAKQAVTTVGCKKTLKKEEGVISSIQPKKLFMKDAEKSVKKPVKAGRVVASRYNQVSNGGSSAVKDLRKRSLPENEEDLRRSDKKRVSLTEKPQGGEQSVETRVKKKWDIPSELVIPKNVVPSEVMVPKSVDHKTPSSVSKMLDRVPKLKNMRCTSQSPRDSGRVKRVAELVGRKSFFSMEDGIDEDDEETICQSLSYAEEPVVEEYPKIRILRHIDETPQDSGAVTRVSQLVGRKTFFNGDDEDEMPVFSFEEEDDEES